MQEPTENIMCEIYNKPNLLGVSYPWGVPCGVDFSVLSVLLGTIPV